MGNKQYTGVSLFTGAGGMDVGFERAGIKVIFANELMKEAAETYVANHPGCNMVNDDIYNQLPQMGQYIGADFVFGGPPCQGFSVAGKMNPDDERSKLIFTFLDVVEKVQPKAFVMSDKAATLGVNCGESTGRNGLLVLNDQGGNRMDVTEEKTSTLRAESHHPPLVFENHSQDCRYRGPDEIAQTVLSTFGTGGNNQPFVVETPKTMKIRCGKEGGGKGPLVQDNKSATLSCNNDQTLFQPKVYGICAKDSNSMKSDNPNSGFYEAKTTRCLDGNGGNPSCNQGGMAVVALEGNGSRPSHHGDGYSEEDVSYTLNATEHHAVAYGLDRAAFNQGKNALYDFAVEAELEPTMVAKGPGAVAQPTFSSSKASFFTEATEETANCLVATDYKDPPLVNDKPYGFYPQMKAECVCMTEDKSGCLVNGTNPGYQNGVIEADYIVRRLTPTECARLQGFPDWWCDDLGIEHPTSEDVYEWYKIFETHRKITGSSSKPKTEKQIRAFLQDPHSDSAEYKMWGNGVALPCVYFVLSGIVWAHSKNS